MDPNACVREMIGLANQIADDGHSVDSAADAIDLANMVLAIDRWLRKSGAMPERWTGK